MLCGNCRFCPCWDPSDVDDGSCTFICICEDVYDYNPRDDGSFCLFLVQYALEHLETFTVFHVLPDFDDDLPF